MNSLHFSTKVSCNILYHDIDLKPIHIKLLATFKRIMQMCCQLSAQVGFSRLNHETQFACGITVQLDPLVHGFVSYFK